MAINNPYIPGDPFSYDLKWLVRKIKEHSEAIAALNENLDERIEAAVIRFLDQHDPVYYPTAADLIASEAKPETIAFIEGYNYAGDFGANLYYITSDYNDVLSAEFYLTLNGANRWAIPIFLTPYVTPEMFGAAGDGVTDDGPAFNIALKFNNVFCGPKTYNIGTSILIDHSNIMIKGNATILKNEGYHKTVDCTRETIDNVSFYDLIFTGMGKEDQSALWPDSNGGIVCATNKSHIKVKNCTFRNLPYGVFIGGENSEYTEITNCTFENCWSAIDTFTIYNSIIADCLFDGCRQPIQLEPNAGIWYNDCIVKGCVTRNSDDYSINLHARGRRVMVTNCQFDSLFRMNDSNFEDCVIDNCLINYGETNGHNTYGGDTVIQNCHIKHGQNEFLTPWTGIIKGSIIEHTDHAMTMSATSTWKMFDCIVLIPDNNALMVGGGSGTATLINIYLPEGRIVTNRSYTDIVFTGYVGGQTPTDTVNVLNTTMKYYDAPNVL